MEEWKNFKQGKWNQEINVEDLKSMDSGVSLSDALSKNATLKNNNNQNGGSV